MTTLIIQPSDADNFLYKGLPNNNFGSQTNLTVGDNGSASNIYRVILKFDISSLPTGIVITAVTFSMYSFNMTGSAEGRTYKAKRLTEIGWIELQATWNNYKTGSAWAIAGGDFTSINESSAIVPSVNNWMNWDVRYQVFDASQFVHFIIMDEDISNNKVHFYSRDEVIQTTLRPKLVIEYFPIDLTTPAKPSKLYSGIKEAYFKDGWENKKYIYIEQKKAQPCIVQFIDTYADTENEE